ncbi:MAG: hypothetical protein KIT31_29070, partial [Deltaproteobacteria bacterium]|nr:hypothetical protein [Deltaproteobacteria bacterium]
ACLVFVVWRLRHEPGAASAAASDGARAAAPTTTAAASPAPPATTARSPVPFLTATSGGVVPYPELGQAGVATDDPLTAYRKANVYPPTSRPLTREHLDLLFPNQRHEQRRPTDADDGVDFLFTADRYFVIGAQQLGVTLDVRRGGKAIPVAIAQAFTAIADPHVPDPQRIPFALAARPDGTYTGTVAPGAHRLARQGRIGVYVELAYGDGGTRQRAHFDFEYTPPGGIPATFTGAFRDDLAAGSLVIHAGVDVAQAGKYIVDCNLYDDRDEPIAWTRAKVDLAAGRAEVPLVFFGKALVDRNARGRLHIGQLRGARFDTTRDPDLEQMPPFAGTYATRSYAADELSDAEWDSPDKQRMIKFLEEQKARGVHQGAAARGDRGAPGDDK